MYYKNKKLLIFFKRNFYQDFHGRSKLIWSKLSRFLDLLLTIYIVFHVIYPYVIRVQLTQVPLVLVVYWVQDFSLVHPQLFILTENFLIIIILLIYRHFYHILFTRIAGNTIRLCNLSMLKYFLQVVKIQILV